MSKYEYIIEQTKLQQPESNKRLEKLWGRNQWLGSTANPKVRRQPGIRLLYETSSLPTALKGWRRWSGSTLFWLFLHAHRDTCEILDSFYWCSTFLSGSWQLVHRFIRKWSLASSSEQDSRRSQQLTRFLWQCESPIQGGSVGLIFDVYNFWSKLYLKGLCDCLRKKSVSNLKKA